MTENVIHNFPKAQAIIHWLFAIVIAECLLIQITEQVERLYCNVGAFQSALEQTPEVLKSIGVHAAINIRDRMVNYLVLKIRPQSDIRHERIRVDRASSLNMVSDFGLKRPFAAIGNGEYSDFSAAFQNAECSGFVFESARSNYAPSSRTVHETSRAANETFIGFNFFPIAAQHKTGFTLHGNPDSMQHEPCCFLGHAQSASYFVGTDSILTVTNHPNGNHPLIHPESRILKDGSHFDGELFLTSLAEPNTARRDKRVLHSAATRARDFAIRPPQKHCIIKSLLRVGEESDRFLQSLWKLKVCVHA